MDDNNPTRFWVTSESEEGVEYVVSLTEYPLRLDEYGNQLYNGACGSPVDRIHGCADFIFRCDPQLKKPENQGKVYRCKHIRRARDHALDFVLPYLAKANPNPDDNTGDPY